MKKAFRKAIGKAADSATERDGPSRPQQHSSSPATTSGPLSAPTSADIFRYRYQHGTNLGGIFILERWMFGSMYDESDLGHAELDAVSASVKKIGVEATRQKWELHWTKALTEEDLDWLTRTACCNHIRLPIGYFSLGPAFCDGTLFSGDVAQVYINAWSMVTSLITRCHSRGVGVLLDLHGVPGGANTESHSGTSTGRAELWGNGYKLQLATKCVTFMAGEVSRSPELKGVVGIQVCNEAGWDPSGMYEWYNEVIHKVSEIDNTIPVYLSDGWDLRRALEFTRAYNRVLGSGEKHFCPVIVDRHQYYTFDEKDTNRSIQELTAQVRSDLSEIDQSLEGKVFDHKSAVAVYVGEYSMALAPQTLGRVPPDNMKISLREFGLTQCRRWQYKASGSAFWTFKLDGGGGGGWSFRQQTTDGNITAPEHLRLSKDEAQTRITQAEEKYQTLAESDMRGHCEYWSRQAPAQQFEHFRFQDGWTAGWADAKAFFAARLDNAISCAVSKTEPQGRIGADKIGALDLWVLKRMREAGVLNRETCIFGWEWEHGFRTGIGRFQEEVRIQ